MTNNKLQKAGFILASSWIHQEKDLFTGTAFTDSSIIIGQDGYQAFSEKHKAPDIRLLGEGRFALVQNRNGDVYARTDGLGQETLYFYFDGYSWAISNSFLWLARHLKEHGARITCDADVMNLWKINHSIAQGLISGDTFIQEIKTLPPDKLIKISQSERGFSLQTELSNKVDCGDVSQDEYVHLLISGASKMASRAYALLGRYGERAKLDITGGQDSRLVLGIVAASGIPLSNLNFQSNKNYAPDFAAASGLATELGFEIHNKPIRISRTDGETAFSLWKAGSLGVYAPIYPALGDSIQTSLHVHGACGECFRDYYLANAVQVIQRVDAKSKDRASSLAFSRQLAKSVAEMGQSIYTNQGMMLHYRNFRSRTHFGRSAYKNLNNILFTPLASLDFLRASRYLDPVAMQESQFALDLLLLTQPKLATLPFDLASKAFLSTAFERSPFFSHAEINRIDYSGQTVYGADTSPPGESRASGSFKEMIIAEVRAQSDAAISTGIFNAADIQAAIDKISTGTRMTIDGLSASHIISVGEAVSLAT